MQILFFAIEKCKSENSITESGYCATNYTLPRTSPYYNACHNIQLKCKVEKTKLDPSIILHGGNNSKWIIDLNF